MQNTGIDYGVCSPPIFQIQDQSCEMGAFLFIDDTYNVEVALLVLPFGQLQFSKITMHRDIVPHTYMHRQYPISLSSKGWGG